jgi:hypothetical protein
MTVPYSFANATVSIPLSQLDANFNTPITLGNTAIQLGNTVTTLNNMTLANVTISSGNVTITNVSVTTANVTTLNATTVIATTANVTTANITTGNVTNMTSGNVAITGGSINGTTLGATTASTANVTTLTTSSTVTINGGTANGVAYLDGSKVLTTGSALTFDGTNFALGAGGDIRAYNTANTRYGRFATTADGTIVESFNGSGEPLILSAPQSTAYVGIKVNNVEQARFNTTGLGIGTSSPISKLHVFKSSDNQLQLQCDNTGLVTIDMGGTTTPAKGGIRFSDNIGALFLRTNSTTQATLDSSGNLGLGVTPSAWNNIFRVMQLGTDGAWVGGRTDGQNQAWLGTNAWWNGSNWIYTAATTAGQFLIKGNEFQFLQAGTGSIGGTATFTQSMTLDASGRLAIGGTSAIARLDVQGGWIRTANGTSTSYFGDGVNLVSGASASSSAVRFDGDSLLFSNGATERARITSGGDFGLGTTSPNAKLAIGVAAAAVDGTKGVRITNSGGGIVMLENGSNNDSYVGTLSASDFCFRTNDTERARITSGGDFLIGLTSSTAKFHVTNGASPASRLIVGAGGGAAGTLYSTLAAGDYVSFETNAAERARITSAGDVGIGTSSPASKLSVVNASSVQIQASTGTIDFRVQSIDANSAAYAGTVSNHALVFTTNNAERARITSGGDLLVGTTDASATSGAGTKLISNGQYFGVLAASTNSDTTLQIYSTGAAAYRFYVGLGGTVYATNTTISAISDQRLKENIQDLDVGLDKIMALKPRKFDWKAGKGKDIKGDRGFIAQEFEQVFPDLIDEWKDPAPEGEEPYKSVRQDLIPVLVKAIQELKSELDSVKAELATLKGK